MGKKRTNPTYHIVREIDRYGNEVRGLSDTQLRVLKVLRDADAVHLENALSLPEIARRIGISEVVTRRAVGAVSPESRPAYDRIAGYTSLLSRGGIRLVHLDSVGVYHLSPSGIVLVGAVADAMSVLGPPRSGGEQ